MLRYRDRQWANGVKRSTLPPSIRNRVFKLANGKCQYCGLDLNELEHIFIQARYHYFDLMRTFPEEFLRTIWWGATEEPAAFWDGHRKSMWRSMGYRQDHTWEVNHIVPVELRGQNEEANLKLACIPCHDWISKHQAGARAKQGRLASGDAALKAGLHSKWGG
jgi:5-methylcytosine-specific restriction endonuclease McrA